MSIYHVTIELRDPTPSPELDESGAYTYGVREHDAVSARSAVIRRCLADGWIVPDVKPKVEKVRARAQLDWVLTEPMCYGKARS